MRAAEAVAHALRARLRARSLERPVVLVDMLAESSRLVRAVCRDAYVGLVQRAPSVVGWLYRRSDRPARSGLRGRMLWAGLRGLRRLIVESGAEAVVSTHFLASEVAARLARERRGPPLHTVVTDIDAHGLWIWPGTTRYFIAGARSRRTLLRAGVQERSIEETGIPIDPAFERVPPRAWAKRVLGLDECLPLVLFSTGGCCVGPVESLLRDVARIRTPAQIAVICGRAEKARVRLGEMVAVMPESRRRTIRIEGFTDRMQVWMAAADLFVGKPGGLTSAECMAAGLPMVIVHAIPGQEEHNADELVSCGAAVRADPVGGTAPVVDALLADPERIASMRHAALASARPDAAWRVAERVVSCLADRTHAPAAGAPRAP